MFSDLKSTLWPQAVEMMRKCHLSNVMPEQASEADWETAFDLLVNAINDERKLDPAFAEELADLTGQTGNVYGFEDILEEYFDHLEEHEKWDNVISSSEKIISLFKWNNKLPSEYMFRKGNALEKSKKFEEAEAFGKEWLDEYPYDLYAAASNVFLKIELKKFDEAQEITEKYLRDELVCDNTSDTFFMAAYRLYEMTDNINAKTRVMQKMNEYQQLNQN